jgi:DNA repair protein RecN (Recombination protein N)
MSISFYLKKLIIQNYATFKNQSICFRPGLNVIVGETGSGKSLVLDALQLILGGRADKRIVRRDTEYALIEATFHCADAEIRQFLESEGYPLEHELVIKRLIYKNGSSKNYINHLSCTVTFLAAFAKRYIDVVGQFENQKLLSESYQLQLLDQFGGMKEKLIEYRSLLAQYKQLQRHQEQLIQSKIFREQRLDYLNYQLQEIEKLDPSSHDEDELLKQKNAMMNIEKTQKTCYSLKAVLEGTEGQAGLVSQVRILSSLMAKHQDIYQEDLGLVSSIEDQLLLIDKRLETRLNFEFNPEDFEIILDRLDAYQRLKKKFGGTTENILQSQQEFLNEKLSLDKLEDNLEELGPQLAELHHQLTGLAEKMHQERSRYAKLLGAELTTHVRHLRMKGATIQVSIEKCEGLNESGITKACFTAETNLGEGYYKIKDIASGGELSRILLSVRQILSQHGSISIFLFDEIDTGIGGETANCIGKALADVASSGQVIAITHLPQIAKFAENLVLVHKETFGSGTELRTESSIKEVAGKLIQKEIKAMAQLH